MGLTCCHPTAPMVSCQLIPPQSSEERNPSPCPHLQEKHATNQGISNPRIKVHKFQVPRPRC